MSETSAAHTELLLRAFEIPVAASPAGPPGSCHVSAPPSRQRATGGRFPRRWPARATLAGSRDAIAAAAASPDGREGVAAFLERRAPRLGASGG